MQVVFDFALDGRAWPGLLGETGFSFGQAWVGPTGFLELLETRLGLGGHHDGLLQRACRLTEALEGSSGYWSESFEVDPLGTCRRLLRDRDDLRMWGWAGEPVSKRLDELHVATATASPGVPDRLEAIAAALTNRRTDIEHIASYTAIENLPPLWHRVFQGLEDAGVVVEQRALELAPATGDLAARRLPDFVPAGDGRLCLLRRHGPLDVADEIAASLAACASLEGVVVCGADEVLDRALVRHGLPSAGADTAAPASARLLPLVIEAAFHPMGIEDLHALLAADPGPVPRRVAAKLLHAIRRFPGRRTPEWDRQLASGLAAIDEDKRKNVEERVTALLLPTADHGEEISVSTLNARLKVLDSWARARTAFVPSLAALSHGIHALVEALELTAPTSLSLHDLRRLCGEIGESPRTTAAQAGLSHVSRPGAILAPARAIVWWNFSRDTAVKLRRSPLTQVEREGLRKLGIQPPDSSKALAIELDAWERPLSQARESLVLACPSTGVGGETNHPHPLWDDITASLGDYRDARKLERDRLVHVAPAIVNPAPLRALVNAEEQVRVASPIPLRDSESPSSIERLLGCPLSWALHYHAWLAPGMSAAPPAPAPLVFGTLAHRFLEQVLNGAPVSPDQAAQRAETVFDEQCDSCCESLGLPQHQADRATLKRAVVESARELMRLASKHGVLGARTEIKGTTVAEGQAIEGYLDLVWDGPDVVVDLKWGKSTQVKKLETGTAIQLAAYASMLETEGKQAETAYFAMTNQHLLAEPDGRLSADARVTGAHRASEVWTATVAALSRRRDSLASGQLEAPGATGDAVQSTLSAEGIEVEPPCKYCDFSALCGRGGAR